MNIIDLEKGKKVFGSSEQARSMLKLFIDDLDDHISKIDEDCRTKKWASMYEKTHSLRGACCYSSTPSLLASVEKLDNIMYRVRNNTLLQPSEENDIHQATEHLKTIAKKTIIESRKY